MYDRRVCVVGLGYIGLPTASLLADNGYNVAGIDIDPLVVETINRGQSPVAEPDLDAFVCQAVTSQRLRAYLEPQRADIYIICVPTPFQEGGEIPQPNLDYVLTATRNLAPLIKPGDLIILESTSPVGSTEQVGKVLQKAGIELEMVYVAYCPERVLPGRIMTELVENDRIVGGLTPEATRKVSEFYRTFVRGEVLETDARTAEMCKLVENSSRDVSIAFANELSLICDNMGINVWRLIELANRHPRVNILQPGTGVGGHCIAVDPWFIVANDPENARLIKTAREVNNRKTEWVIERIKIASADFSIQHGRPPVIACLGLAFKPDVDDLRESPALQVTENLAAQGYQVLAVEPNISEHPSLQLRSLEEAIEASDIVVFLVKHREFVRLADTGGLSKRVILDFCGCSASRQKHPSTSETVRV